MRSTASMLLAALALATNSAVAVAQDITVDGVFSDWAGTPIAATDPANDASGAFDLTSITALTRGTVIYLRWDTNAPVNLQAGDSNNGTMQLQFTFESGQTLTIDTRARVAYRNGNTSEGVSWIELEYVTLPTAAMPEYETRLDVADFAELGETVSVQFAGSDSLAQPIVVTLDQPAPNLPDPQPGDLDPDDCTDFRVVNLNTLRSGLTKPGQQDEIGRILDAFNPQIITLQEEYDNSAATIQSVLNTIDPTDAALTWNVHKEDDNVIASPYPLTPFVTNDDFAMAAVDLTAAGGEPVVIVSVHTKCCGFAGDSSDARRVASMQNLASIITDLRSESLTQAMDPFADAPIVVVGDWNHVGSDIPRQIMIDPAIPGMTHWPLLSAANDHAATWRDRDGFGFMPGMLDLMVYDADRLTQRRGFVLDTQDLAPATLTHYGLQADDSLASDHRAMVTDFAFGPESTTCATDCPPDTNGDGLLDNGDIGTFVQLFLAGDLTVDFNSDAILDNGDIGSFVAAFLAGC